MTQSTVFVEDKENTAAGSNRRWEQIGAAAGIVFVALQIASQSLIQLGGVEPAFNAPAGEIEAFFLSRNPQLAPIGGFLSLLSVIAFLWFLGVLWAALRRGEGEPGWLSLVAFACGIVGIATVLGGVSWELAILRIHDGLAPETARLLFDQGNAGFANFWVLLAGLLIATGVLAVRDGALPRWLGWFALALAPALLAARVVWFAGSGAKFLPYMLFWVWLIATSVVLMRRTRRAGG
ncbi:MAG TPA: hypothetical protein VK879_15235 [Candidatus Sulfomarinibacteraceae bacterium]|nr:hypothetical protein [Candidatus Sulfomarinibacteraceae bacterium]